MTACSPDIEQSSTAIEVKVVATENGYGLERGGKPYTVRGEPGYQLFH